MKKTKIHISQERHCNELESLGSVFMPIMQGVLDGNDLLQSDIVLNWIDIIGWEIASFCNPIKIKYDTKTETRTVFLEVPVGGFALELKHREQYIIDKINAYLGYKAVHKIAINQNANMRINLKQSPTPPNKANFLTESEKKYLNEMIEGINDNKLKEILIKLGENVIISNKEKK